jgi:hypothetical protein
MKTAAKTSKSRRLIFTRIESTALPGVPDLLICDESGKFHMVELKFITANAVSLRPHQVSWLTKHGKSSSWILVKKQKSNMDKSELHVYRADQAIDVKLEGLKVEAVMRQHQPFNWHDVFNLICPL